MKTFGTFCLDFCLLSFSLSIYLSIYLYLYLSLSLFFFLWFVCIRACLIDDLRLKCMFLLLLVKKENEQDQENIAQELQTEAVVLTTEETPVS